MEAREDMGGVEFQRNEEADGGNWVWFESVMGMVRQKEFRNTRAKDGGV